jgi:von Willebrand factor type A domain
MGGGEVTTTPQDFRVLDVDSSSYPWVDSVVVVPRALSGRSLGSDAFEIQAGGASHPVEAVRLDADALELALVVDASVGDDDDFRRAQGALLEVPVHLPGASVAVVRSSRPATVVWPLTGDPVAASRAVRSMSPGGQPALVDGVASALDAFSTDTSPPPSGEATRRAVVVIAGDPVADTYQMVAQAMRARDMGVTFYVISVGDTVPVELDRLATMSGGRAVAVAPRDMVAAIDQTIADLRGQYRLRFSLSDDRAAGLEGQLPGQVVGAVGLRPAAASVTASGTSASVPLTIPPGAGAAADRPTDNPGDSAPPVDDAVWFPTVGMLLLLVVAALAVSRFTSWAAARHAPVGAVPRHEPPAVETIEATDDTDADDDADRPLVDAAGGRPSG